MDGCPASDVRSGQKSANSARVRGFRSSGKVGRPVVPAAPDVRCIGVNVRFQIRTRFWAEFGDFGVKIDEISWMESGENWGNARSTQNQENPWIKINKTSSNHQITKKFGAIFGGDFQN